MTDTKLYRERRRQGLCGDCGKAAVPGKSLCEKCAQAGNSRVKGRLKSLSEAGLCVRCGDPVVPGRKSCEYHLKYYRDRNRAAYTEAQKDYRNGYKYSLTADEYLAWFKNAGCWVCGSREDLHLDHDHACPFHNPKKGCPNCIRGVLCGNHNRIAGFLEHPDALGVLQFLMETRSSAPLIDRIKKLEET